MGSKIFKIFSDRFGSGPKCYATKRYGEFVMYVCDCKKSGWFHANLRFWN